MASCLDRGLQQSPQSVCVYKYLSTMSYIIAYVTFPMTRIDYPMNCYRTDIAADDQVLIRLSTGLLRPGKVTRVLYLDWDCRGQILCKLNECDGGRGKLSAPFGHPKRVGITDHHAFATRLERKGWVRLRATTNIHTHIYGYHNGKDRANIWLRRHGIDLQVLEGFRKEMPAWGADRDVMLSEGKVVRHFLSQTTFNLFEGVLRFSDDFEAGEDDYDRFFRSVGSKSRVTEDLLKRLSLAAIRGEPGPSDYEESGNFEAMLYEALGGDGGRAYVGDGLYLGAAGEWYSD